MRQSSWGPPYKPASSSISPLFLGTPTCDSRGFEEPTFFTAADGHLHFIAHFHGACASGRYAHYVNTGRSLARADWSEAPPFGGSQPSPPGAAFEEPVPVPKVVVQENLIQRPVDVVEQVVVPQIQET